MVTDGTRIEVGEGIFWRAGDYWHDGERWMAATPNDMLANLTAHTVVEHEDRTITVSPSILTTGGDLTRGGDISWHGYLERGVWREV